MTYCIQVVKTSKVLPFIVTGLVAGIGGFILSQLQISIWLEPSPSGNGSPPIIEVDQAASPPRPTDSNASPGPQSQLPPTLAPTAAPNSLRVSNRTPKPLRVVLLAHQSPSSSPLASPSRYEEPVHWDFAPQEGSQQGLLLSLPDSDLRLSPGDVLLAFALDGSRRYWGPYVVGDTTVPTQQTEGSPWELVLEP